jgi:hypothetical protein
LHLVSLASLLSLYLQNVALYVLFYRLTNNPGKLCLTL